MVQLDGIVDRIKFFEKLLGLRELVVIALRAIVAGDEVVQGQVDLLGDLLELWG